MATADAQAASALDPNAQVDLKTLPISPTGDHDPSKATGAENIDPAGNKSQDPDEVTVFHDPDNFNVKHPLMHQWTLWFTKPPSGKGDSWTDLLKEVVTFDSVEEFWGIYNNITPTSELAVKSDYHLFKKGVRPEWEDGQNRHGGKWSYSFREKRNVQIDELWLFVMLAAIGETLEEEGDEEVMGVVVNVRKGFYRIGVWTKNGGKNRQGDANAKARGEDKNRSVLMAMGTRFKDVLKLPENETVEFNSHTDAASSGSTRARAKFTV